MDRCNTWPPNPEELPESEVQNTSVHTNNSNVPFAPILFQGENVMALPAQWVFAHLSPPHVDQFVTAEDILRPPYQTAQPPPPILMLPTSTAYMGLDSIAAGARGGNGSLMMDPLAEYESGARLEAQGRETDMSLDIAMAMEDQRPMYFVLSRFQPPSVTHVTTVPPPSMPPQPTEEHLHDMLMVPDMYAMDTLPRDDPISMGAFHGAGMTISPADTMNSPLHSSLTPAMDALSAATPNMVGSPYLPAKDEPGEGEGFEYYEYDDENDLEGDNDNDMEEDDDNENDRSSSIDNTMTNDNDNDAKLRSKRRMLLPVLSANAPSLGSPISTDTSWRSTKAIEVTPVTSAVDPLQGRMPGESIRTLANELPHSMSGQQQQRHYYE
ncbi:hypothetical protein KI688_003658 [Linnemannia hyalina]|uniref:Uncharacterized protein n=1 Tax=Linnemannia hyalina TaxID=64524 RepID=A0A9P7XQN1_9FUNG|nr:hypothetical protein KI688_003658 [Linnemannia hyalina]